MHFAMSIAMIVEIALSVLLAATLVYCAILERRLAAIRKGQDGFKATVTELNAAVLAAQNSIHHMKSTAASATQLLDEKLVRAQRYLDELSVLTASGERIADRIERGVTSERPKPSSTPAVLANRLDALRPQNLRGDGARAAGQAR